MTNKEIIRYSKEIEKYKIKCTCGHTVVIFPIDKKRL